MSRALLLLADGVEEMEAVIVIDVLRRAEWAVVTASLQEGVVRASRDVRLLGDQVLSNVDASEFDVLVLPGGLCGVEQFVSDQRVIDLIQRFSNDEKRVLAAICAAPLALQKAGVLEGRRYTSHPSVAEQLMTGDRVDDRVVVDGGLITSQGPGTAFEFALKLVETKGGVLSAQSVADALILPD